MAAKKAKKKPSAKQLAARRKFAAAAKARGKAAKKRNGTVIKAKRIEHLDVSKIHSLDAVPNPARWKVTGVDAKGNHHLRIEASRAKAQAYAKKHGLKNARITEVKATGSVARKNPARKRNVTSAFDLVLAGEAKATTRDGVKGWMVAKKFFPRSATPKTARLTSGAMLDLKYGDVWKLKRKGNPKYLVTGTKTTRKVEDLGILDDKSATAAIARARKLYKGHTNVKARKKNISQGFYDSNGIFHPIRAASDYDGKTAGETGGKPRRTRSKKRAASARKASQTARQKAATKQRKATTTRLATRSLQRSYPLKGKRNPNDAAKAGYESFQGKTSTKSTALNFPNGTPANVYKLGSLHSITLADGRTIKPAGKAVWLCADTKGKLHLGTTGERLTNAPKGSLGKVKEVEYITSKPHLGDNKPARYFHQLGEETGEKPTLYSDGNGGLVFKGGAYSVTSRGIVN